MRRNLPEGRAKFSCNRLHCTTWLTNARIRPMTDLSCNWLGKKEKMTGSDADGCSSSGDLKDTGHSRVGPRLAHKRAVK